MTNITANSTIGIGILLDPGTDTSPVNIFTDVAISNTAGDRAIIRTTAPQSFCIVSAGTIRVSGATFRVSLTSGGTLLNRATTSGTGATRRYRHASPLRCHPSLFSSARHCPPTRYADQSLPITTRILPTRQIPLASRGGPAS
jgi:hypothetical protein